MANNNILFNAALAGASMGASNRWLTVAGEGFYTGIQNAVVAFATQVDSGIAPGSFGESDASLLAGICQGLWQGRVTVKNIPVEYAYEASRVIALWTLLRTSLQADPLGDVTSVFGRTGIVVAQAGDYSGSLVTNDSAVAGATVTNALETLAAVIMGLMASNIGNDSGVAGASVAAALDTLNAAISPATGGQYNQTGSIANAAGSTATSNYQAVNSNAFVETFAGNGLALTANGCVVTYTGSTRRFRVTFAVTVPYVAAVLGNLCRSGIDHNGDLIGTAPAGTECSQTYIPEVALVAARATMTTTRIVTMANGDTVQPAVAVTSGGNNLTIQNTFFLVEPV